MSHSSSLAGAERTLIELLVALGAKGVQLFVILPSRGPMFDRLMELGVQCTVIRFPLWMGEGRSAVGRLGRAVAGAFAAIPLLVRICKWRVDVVCTNTVVIFTGALAAWLARKPHVWVLHEMVDSEYGLVPYLPMRLTMRLVDIWSQSILTVSETVRTNYSQYLRLSKMHVAYPAAIMETGRQRGNEVSFKQGLGVKCASIGALVPGKGHSIAIMAVGALNKMGTSVQLTIVGDGPHKRTLQNLVEELHIGDRVFFTGFIPNVSPVLKAADIVLVCSRREGFGRVTLEAMRVGMPVIAAASGGNLELIRDGLNGLLFESGNYRDLTRKLAILVQFPALRVKLGQAGKVWARRFSLEEFGESVMKCLIDVLKGKE